MRVTSPIPAVAIVVVVVVLVMMMVGGGGGQVQSKSKPSDEILGRKRCIMVKFHEAGMCVWRGRGTASIYFHLRLGGFTQEAKGREAHVCGTNNNVRDRSCQRTCLLLSTFGALATRAGSLSLGAS